MNREQNYWTGLIAVSIMLADQLTKQIVLARMALGDEIFIVQDFFKLVHWTNTGAAWSLFTDQNEGLAIVSLLAVLCLFLGRRQFEVPNRMGVMALGLIFGGICGNLFDRLLIGHVVDFLRFFVITRHGQELGFPAFNVADSAICVGVTLMFLQIWKLEHAGDKPAAPVPVTSPEKPESPTP